MPNKQIKTDIEVREFAIDAIENASYNPRFMPEEHRKGLAESVQHFGVLRLPIVNISTDPPRLVSGHQLVEDLRAKGYTHVECAVVRFDATAERAANLALNNRAIQGSYDPGAIADLEKLRDKIPSPDFTRFETALADVRKAAAQFKAEHSKKADDGSDSDDESTDSESGKVYALDAHRLYCGDFRDAAEVLLPKYYAHACVTDPPYNVGYTSGKRWRKDKLRVPIEGDDQEGEAWDVFIDAVADVLLRSVRGPMYVFMSAQELPAFEGAWLKHKGIVQRWLVMAKNAHPLSPSDYHPQYELCLYGGHKDAEWPYYGKPTPNVLEVPRPSRNPLHPTQKSVDLVQLLLENSTDVEETVFDPFAGSGTTLVVCEQLARVCYSAEISPAYCDTIRRRWAIQVHGKDCDWKALTPEV